MIIPILEMNVIEYIRTNDERTNHGRRGYIHILSPAKTVCKDRSLYFGFVNTVKMELPSKSLPAFYHLKNGKLLYKEVEQNGYSSSSVTS